MTFSSCLIKDDTGIVLDASVIINLLATDRASEIVRSLGTTVVTTESVAREIQRGGALGRREYSGLNELIEKNVIEVCELGERSTEIFFGLVSGSAANSLGDGEAATLALSEERRYVAAIDERKATRMASEGFPLLKVATTIDILSYAGAQGGVSKDALSESVLSALKVAKMQVWDHQFEWVVNLIGLEAAKTCSTLRRHVRMSRNN